MNHFLKGKIMFVPNLTQVGLLLAGLTTSQAPAMQKVVTFSDQMQDARGTFQAYLEVTEKQLASLQAVKGATPKFLHDTVNALTSIASNAAGYGNVTPEEMKFVNRLFEDPAKKQSLLTDFLKNPAKYREHIFKIFNQYQARQQIEAQTDPTNLLIDVLHQETIARLKQNPKTTRVEMAQRALAKDKTEKYIIPDEEYMPVVVVNFFATHMYEQFFKK